MKVRELIEILAKKNWDAQVRLDLSEDASTSVVKETLKNIEICINTGNKIRSVSSFIRKGRNIVTLNNWK